MSLQTTNMMAISSLLNPEPQPNEPVFTETYWPLLRDSLLEDPRLFNQLHLECGICYDQMTVFPHQHTFDPDKNNHSHRARILPCGHMFGNKCINAHMDQAIESKNTIACPACRFDFSDHPDCKHAHSGMPMPMSIEAIEKFPPVISEGGKVGEKCGDCQCAAVVAGLAYLIPMFLSPFGLADRDGLIIHATTRAGVWCAALKLFGFAIEDYAEGIPMGGEMQLICDLVKRRLRENLTKSWVSEDLAGLELSIQRQRIPRPRFPADLRTDGFRSDEQLQRFMTEVVNLVHEYVE